MVDRGGLENRCGPLDHRGFESHPLRLIYKPALRNAGGSNPITQEDAARLKSRCQQPPPFVLQNTGEVTYVHDQVASMRQMEPGINNWLHLL